MPQNHTQSYKDFNRSIQRRQFRLDYNTFKWRQNAQWLQNASISPQTIRGHGDQLCHNPNQVELYNGAVYQETGEVIPESLHLGSPGLINIPDVDICSSTINHELLTGTWLYGGILKVDFGHTLTEGLGRLWLFDQLLERPVGVIFILMNGIPKGDRGSSFSEIELQSSADYALTRFPHINQIYNFFAPGITIRLVGTPVVCEQLIVPSQLMGLCPGGLIGGHDAYRAMLSRRIGQFCQNPSSISNKIYISRASLSLKSGGFSNEIDLEKMLEAEGYIIVRPEEESFEDQLRMYSTASIIILPSGSAIHALALVANKYQSIAIVNRHPGTSSVFCRQLNLMGAAKVVEIDRLIGHFQPIKSEASSKMRIHPARGVYEIDTVGVFSDLHKHGFVGSPKATIDFGLPSSTHDDTIMLLRKAYPSHDFVYTVI